jgi:hypothetical protein
MEGINKSIEAKSEKMNLELFQDEMAAFVAREISGEEESGHFLEPNKDVRQSNINFDASELTEEDRDIWEKIKDKSITSEEFHAYAGAVSHLDKADPTRASRVIFSEFAGNMSMRAIFERAFPEKEQ